MLMIPAAQDFKWWTSNTIGTRPAGAGFGTAITPGTAPTFSAWTQIFTGANVAYDVYGILICINNFSTSATTRNVLVDIGVDSTGGTGYVTKIPYLLGGHATPYLSAACGGGIWYYFPLYIKAGSSIAVRSMGNVVTAGNIFVTIYGQPKRPDAVRAGTKVFAFGQTTATATGTTVTLGTTAEGAWTQVGSATTMPLWWWQVGYTCIDTTMASTTGEIIHMDVAGGTNSTSPKTLLLDIPIFITTAEQFMTVPLNSYSSGYLASGQNVYVRGQVSAAGADTSPSMMAWGLG